MLCQKQIDNFFDTSYGNKEIFFIKLRVQGLHKNPVKTASAKSDETIFLKYQVYRKEQLYMGKKVLKADTVVKNSGGITNSLQIFLMQFYLMEIRL